MNPYEEDISFDAQNVVMTDLDELFIQKYLIETILPQDIILD